MNIDRDLVTRAFDEYVSGYDAADPKIRLKLDHTYRVAALCEDIAASIGIEDTGLAWLCGMLHDIGRFEQIRRYNTFIDALSVDHANFGADLLFREGLIGNYFPEGLPGEALSLLECAIRNHSAYRIPEGLSEAEQTYCHILRDADKLDIFRVNCETPMESIIDVTTEALRAAPVSEAVRACFINRTAVERSLKRTPADYVVAHICLVFELVFPASREIARSQGYVDRMLAFESDNPATRAWFDAMRQTLWKD